MADAHAEKHHDYHLVNPSPWPAIGALFAFITAVGGIIWMRSLGGGEGLFGLRGPWAPSVFAIGFTGILFTMLVWWRDVIKEAHAGDHTPVVQLHLRYGMILFIASEVMFFVAWFWAYFDASLFPGGVYPLEVTTPDGATEATKQVIGMVERNALTGGHWPPQPSARPSTAPSTPGGCRWSTPSFCCCPAPPSRGRTTRCSTTTAGA